MDNSLEKLIQKEYLLTNGLGGYSSATVSGANTRRYHGLLVASFNPPTERLVMIAKTEETIQTPDGFSFELSTNQYPGTIHPEGAKYIKAFISDTTKAQWIYEAGNGVLKKTIQLVEGENTVYVYYKNLSDQPFDLLIRPFLVYKDYHSLFKEEAQFDFYQSDLPEGGQVVYAKYEARPLYMRLSYGQWNKERAWYKNFQLTWEKDRGFDYEEDAMSIGYFRCGLNPGEETVLVLSTKPIGTNPVHVADPELPGDFKADLERSSRQFVVRRHSTSSDTIIAGYHWFTDWGRDTMIAMRGISISTGRQEEARSILHTFLSSLSEGLLPNRFPDYEHDPIEYNTIDATLWLFIAIYEYYQKYSDADFLHHALPHLKEVINWHIKGTKYNIHLLEDGLLYGGEPGYQLTWMDARVGDHVVTPRIGCPVEINALWYNALCVYNELLVQTGAEEDKEVARLKEQCKQAFRKWFLHPKGYLYDLVIPEVYLDESIRPNQIYAVSLPFSPLSAREQQRVLQHINEQLLTHYGLRTLAPTDPAFMPRYEGDAWHRDNAYHQGTVWPFLWGEWAMATLKLANFSPESCAEIWEHSNQLRTHFYEEDCILAISEIFDGLEPSGGKGCVQQAWSIGNLLNVFLHQDFKLPVDKSKSLA